MTFSTLLLVAISACPLRTALIASILCSCVRLNGSITCNVAPLSSAHLIALSNHPKDICNSMDSLTGYLAALDQALIRTGYEIPSYLWESFLESHYYFDRHLFARLLRNKIYLKKVLMVVDFFRRLFVVVGRKMNSNMNKSRQL